MQFLYHLIIINFTLTWQKRFRFKNRFCFRLLWRNLISSENECDRESDSSWQQRCQQFANEMLFTWKSSMTIWWQLEGNFKRFRYYAVQESIASWLFCNSFTRNTYLPGHTPPTDRMTDRHLWNHYLLTTWEIIKLHYELWVNFNRDTKIRWYFNQMIFAYLTLKRIVHEANILVLN